MNELLKPGGLFISATPCTGEKKSSSVKLSLLGKVGVIPNVTPFKFCEVENLMDGANFKTVEAGRVNPDSLEYFIAARKI